VKTVGRAGQQADARRRPARGAGGAAAATAIVVRVTCVTPLASEAVPPSTMVALPVPKGGLDVGAMIVIVGGGVSSAIPVSASSLEIASPAALNVTFEFDRAGCVG